MEISTVRLIVFIILLFHGIGHYMGIVAVFGIKISANMTLKTSVPYKIFGEKPAISLAIILFFLAFAGFISAALGMYGKLIPFEAWQTIAVIASVISLLCVILFWNGFAFLFNKIGAIIINGIVLACILWLHWPPGIIGR